MATQPRIDVEALTLPVQSGPERDPVLERDSVHYQFRQFLRSTADQQPDADRPEARISQLSRLIDLGEAYLTRKSKDLVVAAWMTEALTQTHGFAGLRDGLTLLKALIARCWEDCYPPPGPDNDFELRARQFAGIASERSLVLCLRRVPLADLDVGAKPFCLLDVGEGPPGRRPAPTETDVTTGPIGEAVNRSPRSYYERLADDLREAADADRTLGHEVVQRFRADAPDLRPLGRVLLECQRLIEIILAVKRRQEPFTGEEAARTDHAASDGQVAQVVASYQPPVGPGPTSAALRYGRALIKFADRARSLADDSARLKANREEYESLREKMRELDVEYENIANRIAGDPDYKPLFVRQLGHAGEKGASEPPSAALSE
jgi:type VI secretion system protein ImpA